MLLARLQRDARPSVEEEARFLTAARTVLVAAGASEALASRARWHAFLRWCADSKQAALLRRHKLWVQLRFLCEMVRLLQCAVLARVCCWMAC